MLRGEEIVEIARLRKLKPWQEEKRYLQALILYAVSEWPLVLKGGTYLWLFHGLNRFSVDLDFTATGNISTSKVKEIPEALRLFGAESSARYRYTLTIRVAVKGPLYRTEKDTSYIRLDISRREKTITKTDKCQARRAPIWDPSCIPLGPRPKRGTGRKVEGLLCKEKPPRPLRRMVPPTQRHRHRHGTT
jgi:hypothetical protein